MADETVDTSSTPDAAPAQDATAVATTQAPDSNTPVVADDAGNPKMGTDGNPIAFDPDAGVPVTDAPQGDGQVVADPQTGAPVLDGSQNPIPVDPDNGVPTTTDASDTPVVADPQTGDPVQGSDGAPIAVSTGDDASTDASTSADTTTTDSAPNSADATADTSAPGTSGGNDVPVDQHPAPSNNPIVDPTSGNPIAVDPTTGVPTGGTDASGGQGATSAAPGAPDANALQDAYDRVTEDGKQLAEEVNQFVEDGGALLLCQMKAAANYAQSLAAKLEAAAAQEGTQLLQNDQVQAVVDGAKGLLDAVAPFVSSSGDGGSQPQSLVDHIKEGLQGVQDAVRAAFDKLTK